MVAQAPCSLLKTCLKVLEAFLLFGSRLGFCSIAFLFSPSSFVLRLLSF